jgi:pimeloyl-ACP methyl ester carboxylesterase
MAIWGERDGIIPVAHAYAAHEARTDARLEVLPDVGHFAQVEAPNRVVELIEDFIAAGERRDTEREQPFQPS